MLEDLIWERWYYKGEPDAILGEHELQLEVPSGWHQVVSGQKIPILSMAAKVQVVGCIVTLLGGAEHLSLIDAATLVPERTLIHVSFDSSRSEYPVTILETEDELRVFLEGTHAVNISIGRFRLPQIHAGPCYWPPSKRTAQKLTELMTAWGRGVIPDPRPIDIKRIEGTDMRTMWEPMLQDWPSVKRNGKHAPWHERETQD